MEQMAANIKQNADNASQTEKIARQSAIDRSRAGDRRRPRRRGDAHTDRRRRSRSCRRSPGRTDLLRSTPRSRRPAPASTARLRGGRVGVRKLAERSQASATEISALSSQTVTAAQRPARCGQLVPDIRKTAELVSEISAACREAGYRRRQINQAIQQLDKVTQQTASASEQMSATSEELAANPSSFRPASAISVSTKDARAAAGRRAPPAGAGEPTPTRDGDAPIDFRNGRAAPAKNGHDKQQRASRLDLVSGGATSANAEFQKY